MPCGGGCVATPFGGLGAGHLGASFGEDAVAGGWYKALMAVVDGGSIGGLVGACTFAPPHYFWSANIVKHALHHFQALFGSFIVSLIIRSLLWSLYIQ